MCICIVSDETLHGFHPFLLDNLSVGKPQRRVGDGRPSPSGMCVWDSLDQALGSLMCSFNDWPVGLSVNHDEVAHPFVGEEIRTDALEGVGRWDWGIGECC